MKHLKIYHEADSEDVRERIQMNVWDTIQSKGGRFLLQVEDGQLWEKLEVQAALYKIGQAFDFLCVQLYTPKTISSKDVNGKLRDDDDLFYGWNDLFDGKKCFHDLIHCKAPICW